MRALSTIRPTCDLIGRRDRKCTRQISSMFISHRAKGILRLGVKLTKRLQDRQQIRKFISYIIIRILECSIIFSVGYRDIKSACHRRYSEDMSTKYCHRSIPVTVNAPVQLAATYCQIVINLWLVLLY